GRNTEVTEVHRGRRGRQELGRGGCEDALRPDHGLAPSLACVREGPGGQSHPLPLCALCGSLCPLCSRLPLLFPAPLRFPRSPRVPPFQRCAWELPLRTRARGSLGRLALGHRAGATSSPRASA